MTKDRKKINVTTSLSIEIINALDDLHFETKVPKCELITDALLSYKRLQKYL